MTQTELAIHTPVEVLNTQLDINDLLAKIATIEELFKTSFIPTNCHSRYARWIDKSRILKRCGRAVSSSHTGISRSSIHYRNEDRKRISYVCASTKITSNKLFSLILKDVNHAAWRGNSKDLQARLVECLDVFGINLLLIDNAEYLQRETILDIKQIHKETGIPIILIGKRVLNSNLIKNDFSIYFPALFEFDPLDEEDFKKTLETIELDILALPQASNLWEGRLFEMLVSSTQSRIGILIEVLSEAVMDSLSKGHERIDETVLQNIANRNENNYELPEIQNRQRLSSV